MTTVLWPHSSRPSVTSTGRDLVVVAACSQDPAHHSDGAIGGQHLGSDLTRLALREHLVYFGLWQHGGVQEDVAGGEVLHHLCALGQRQGVESGQVAAKVDFVV